MTDRSPALQSPSLGANRNLRQVRLIAACIATAAILLLLVRPAWPAGFQRPAVLSGSPGAGLAVAAFYVALGLAALSARVILGGDQAARVMLALAVGVAVLIWQRGTLDDWLIQANPVPGPPTASPYSGLLIEYVLIGPAFVIALLIALSEPGAGRTWAPRISGAGASGLLVVVAVAFVLIPLLVGPASGATYRGQVVFAVAVAFYAGGLAAMQLSPSSRDALPLAAPLIVGLLGVGWAMMRPAASGPYAAMNIIPANGLVRPLPLEMLFFGSAALLAALASSPRSGRAS